MKKTYFEEELTTMVVNIYDTANEMERQMRETQEFQALKKAFDDMQKDADASLMFTKFQAKQAAAEKKERSGQQLTKDEITEIQSLAKEVSTKPAVQNLLNQERGLDQMMQKLNQIITEPIRDLYNSAMPKSADNENK